MTIILCIHLCVDTVKSHHNLLLQQLKHSHPMCLFWDHGHILHGTVRWRLTPCNHDKGLNVRCIQFPDSSNPVPTPEAVFTILFPIQQLSHINTLRTGDADLRCYITTVQDGWRKSAFLTRACIPCTIHLIMQYIETVSEWSCWRMFKETWPHSELTFRHRASSI